MLIRLGDSNCVFHSIILHYPHVCPCSRVHSSRVLSIYQFDQINILVNERFCDVKFPYTHKLSWRNVFSFNFYYLFFVDCPIPSKPLNSRMNYTGTKANNIVNYSCLTGYNLAGQAIRRCLITSEWENDDPTCLRRCIILIKMFSILRNNWEHQCTRS